MLINEIQQIAEIMNKSGIDTINYDDGKIKLMMEKKVEQRGQALVQNFSSQTVENPLNKEQIAEQSFAPIEKLHEIKSPMVGVFYSSPEPGASAYVKEGTVLSRGQILCVIEAMKLMNDIASDIDGTVSEVCVSNGEVVEFGQVLFRIKAN